MRSNQTLLSENENLCKEWNYQRNFLWPHKYSYGSKESVWWICKKCSFEWKAAIYDRSNNKGCPRCANKVVDKTNSLLTKNPTLCEEWDFEKNEFGPDKYAPFSNKKVWWVYKCGFKWNSKICERSRGHNCPRCCNQFVDITNCLLTKNPDLCMEWDYENNSLPPSCFVPNSGKRVLWVCKKCGNKWEAVIRDRNRGGSCPVCYKRYSKKCEDWINSFDNPNIQKSIRIYIPGFKKKIEVDGFDKTTNTIYEFYGDLWHGNIKHFKEDKINKFLNKTYKELFDKTIKRENLIKEAGYSIIFIWEYDWNKQKKGIKND